MFEDKGHGILNFSVNQDINEFCIEELLKILNENEKNVSILSKENLIYECILKEQVSYLDSGGTTETEITETEDATGILSFAEKCFLFQKHFNGLEKNFQNEKSISSLEIKECKQELESVNLMLKSIQDTKKNFLRDILLMKHPLTKRIMLQKLAKYLDDSLKSKRSMSYRYKIQIESLTMECNKLLNQIKDQNKRLAALDSIKCQEMKYEYLRACQKLDQCKENLVLCKNKYSTLGQKVFEMKKNLKEEETKLKETKESLSKKEYVKDVVLSEKIWNDQQVELLNKAIHKIRVDPRRHDLPEVVDYALIKRQNEKLKLSIKLWNKKVAVAEQAKLMHLNSMKKKRRINT